MVAFALISEGVTDQIILERIIDQICGELFEGDIHISALQPLRDATDAVVAPHGGWELVFEYCEHSAAAALEANDYVVVHLDTDQGDHPAYGLPLTSQGVDRSFDAIVADAIDIIAKRVGEKLYAEHIGRFLFAISVHSMESWLLLCLCNVDETKNCLRRFNRHRSKRDLEVLAKNAPSYKRIAREIGRKRLLDLNTTSHSLGLFITQLFKLKIPPIS